MDKSDWSRLEDEVFPLRPCLGCGYCCKKAPCIRGAIRYGTSPPCGALRWDDEAKRYWCGLVLEAPDDWRDILKDDLYIGCGCSSSLNTDRRKMEQRARGKETP